MFRIAAELLLYLVHMYVCCTAEQLSSSSSRRGEDLKLRGCILRAPSTLLLCCRLGTPLAERKSTLLCDHNRILWNFSILQQYK